MNFPFSLFTMVVSFLKHSFQNEVHIWKTGAKVYNLLV